MKPLLVLLSAFVISLLATRLLGNSYDVALSGRIAMSAMLLFTAIAHAAFTKGMTMMLPPFVPYKTALVYLTGVIEVVAAVALLLPPTKEIAGWWLIVFFLLILPANIYAAMHHIDYQKGTAGGSGPTYLWFRVPLQLFFIVWVYCFAIRY